MTACSAEHSSPRARAGSPLPGGAAVFGSLEREKDPVYNSVCAAIEFRDAIREMNKERVASGNEPIGVGVGVNTGPLVAGFIGSKQRLEYTCIGDSVNVSSRLCAMAEPTRSSSRGPPRTTRRCAAASRCASSSRAR